MTTETLTLDPRDISNEVWTKYSPSDLADNYYITIKPTETPVTYRFPFDFHRAITSSVLVANSRANVVANQAMLTLTYETLFFVFFTLSIIFGGLILLSAITKILFINPNILFYGFLCFVGLAATAFAGMKSKRTS